MNPTNSNHENLTPITTNLPKRAMCIWFPSLAIDLLRRRDTRRSSNSSASADPLLLATLSNQRQVVARCCEHAARVGVRPGLPVSQARALFPNARVRIEDFTPRRDRAALGALGQWAMRFSPVVALDEPPHTKTTSKTTATHSDPHDALLLDLTGCDRVFGGEPQLLARARTELARLGFHTRIAIAPTFAGARAVARFAPADETILHPRDLRGSLMTLPVASLALDTPTLAALAEVGLDCLGDLLALPRSVLPARFGESLTLALDRALGEAIEMITPLRPRAPVRAEQLFEGPTDRLEAIELAVRTILDDLAQQLARLQHGVTRMRLELKRSDLEPAVLGFAMSRPVLDSSHLWTLVRPRLERTHLGFGVEAVRLHATRLERAIHDQPEHWSHQTRDQPATDTRITDTDRDRLLDALINRLGESRVLHAVPGSSHLPERGTRLEPVTAAPSRPAERTLSDDAHAGIVRGITRRPAILLNHPEPIEVIALSPDGPVHRIRWLGEDRRITDSTGPERIAPEWWRSTARARTTPAPFETTRDYFRVQDETGRWLWIFRQRSDRPAAHQAPGRHPDRRTDRWFVHGLWS